jgi:capsular polysaccharide transport system ATP-binding protein
MRDGIEFDHVSKHYRLRGGRRVILRGLTLGLPRRNIGLLAANGAGKSTLLCMISGAEPPTGGRIRRHARVSWPLGFGGGFNNAMTGLENARFVARIYGEDVRRVLRFVAEFSELGDFFSMPVATYSAGMRAKLAFGVSLAIAFDIYLVDEITEVGDERFKERCRAHFKEKLKNANVIMVSHGLPSLRSYCDMGAVLADGELRLFDTLEKAIDVYRGQMQAA